MSLFGSLFDEGGNENDDDEDVVSSAGRDSSESAVKCDERPAATSLPKPPDARPEHGLCGIFNRGATCYLNSLLQTLSMTPEFCTRLFQLGTDELGCLSERDVPGSKVRVIPLELQRLFGRLLLLNVVSISTAELTSSFGWNSHEESEQHDIQELNRILFSAMEESLVGTAGQSLINDLYHGKMTNTITCGSCGKASRRDEDFLDLCVSVSGSSTLQDSLAAMFLDLEVLDACNQYRCDGCGQLADARKSSRLRHVPPILTVSLLRFNYDPVKMERFKETGHFEFPSVLDMSAFVDDDDASVLDSRETTSCKPDSKELSSGKPSLDGKEMSSGEPGEVTGCGDDAIVNGLDCGEKSGLSNATVCGDSPSPETKTAVFGHTYELFSVVVHRGGAHGGHYHALIRDLDGRGSWSEPSNSRKQEAVVSSTTDKTPTVPRSNGALLGDLDLACPRSVVAAILLESGGMSGISVPELSEKIISMTGESWRKRYKSRHGSLMKFLTDNCDLFLFDAVNSWICLVPGCEQSQIKNKPRTEEAEAVETDGPRPLPVQDSTKPKKKKSTRSKRSENLDISSPKSVITCILLNAGEAGLSVTDLCTKITEVTGNSWRKRFKPKYGSLVKFLDENSDQFVHDVSGGWVSLVARPTSDDASSEISDMLDVNGNKENGSSGSSPSGTQHSDVSSTVISTNPAGKRRKKKSKLKPSEEMETVTVRQHQNTFEETVSISSDQPLSTPSQCWFDFNDTTIRPILTEDIRKHYSGKECAYMLFYRAVPATDSSRSSKHMEIPDWLISEITAENLSLEQQRTEYQDSVNVVTVEVHFGRSYEYHENVLRPRVGSCYYVEQVVDLRHDASLLMQVVGETGGELVEQCCTIHVAKSLPYGGLHLYQEVTSDPTSSLKSSGVVQSSKLFVWNGREVDGMPIPVGYENEPVILKFEAEKSREVATVSVAKNTTILALRTLIAGRLHVTSPEKIQLCRMKGAEYEPLISDLKTVNEVGLRAKDRIVVRYLGLRTGPQSPTLSPVSPTASGCRNVLPRNITVCCENHVGSNIVMVEVDVESAASVEELKVLIMTSADVPIELVTDVRLRVRLDDLGIRGLGPPLYEGVDLAAAGLKEGLTLVLERGKAPQGTEITLTVSVSASTELELTVDRDTAVHQLLHQVLMHAGTSIDGDEWHLCLSDWTGDAGAVLSDPNKTVADAGLNHGDHIYLRPGCPPPPGFLKIFIHLMSSPARLCWWDPEKGSVRKVSPEPINSVVISKLSTLIELKEQVMTILPDVEVPSPQFLRLQILTSKLQPSGILREHRQILSKLKIANGCALGVELLPAEEDLRPEETLLVVRRRLPGERSYGECAQEVVWNTSHGSTISSLCTTVAEAIGESASCVRIAKHIPDRHEWLIIPHNAFRAENSAVCAAGGGKKKRKKKGKNFKPNSGGGGGASSRCDLKSAPFHLQDGDVIGVKVSDEPGGEDSDFGSVEDDLGKEALISRQKESDALREAMKKSDAKTSTGSQRRVEASIKIHVDNFR